MMEGSTLRADRDLADLRVALVGLASVLRDRWAHLQPADRVRVAELLEQVLRLVMRGRPLRVLRGGAAR